MAADPDRVDASTELYSLAADDSPTPAGQARWIVERGGAKCLPWECDCAVTFPSRHQLARMIEEEIENAVAAARESDIGR